MPIRKLYVQIPAVVIIIFAYAGINYMHNAAGKLPKLGPNLVWKQVFGDEFNGASLDSSKWATCYDWYSESHNGCSNNGNNELEWYMPSQVTVRNGYAQLTAVADATTGLNVSGQEKAFPYRSGEISTGRDNWNSLPKESFTYGYFEARMKFTSGKGIWPAFWLLPADHSWPPEIDVVESLGNKPKQIIMTYHWGTASSPQKDYSIYPGLTNPNGWHTYAVNWQPGRIDWYIDGVLRKSVRSPNVPSKPMEVIANLAIGGNLPGNPNKATVFPATVDIDYIRVYQASPKLQS